jgi:hypothetical protein
MQNVYYANNFRNENVECKKCGWVGKGSETKFGEYLFLTEATEVHCPDCKSYLGIITHEINSDRPRNNHHPG